MVTQLRATICALESQCPPCRGFTPVLAEFYDEVTASTTDLEIVFVSSDSDKSSFDEYFGTMPWKALPFGSAQKEVLSAKFGVRGIPTLVGE